MVTKKSMHFPRNSATLVHRLCLVLQLNPIPLKCRSGAVFAKQLTFPLKYNPFNTLVCGSTNPVGFLDPQMLL